MIGLKVIYQFTGTINWWRSSPVPNSKWRRLKQPRDSNWHPPIGRQLVTFQSVDGQVERKISILKTSRQYWSVRGRERAGQPLDASQSTNLDSADPIPGTLLARCHWRVSIYWKLQDSQRAFYWTVSSIEVCHLNDWAISHHDRKITDSGGL